MRPRATVCLVLLLLGLCPAAALSATSSPYTVTGLTVSAEAEDGVKAKEKAISQAMAEALRQVIGRIGVGDKLPSPNARQAEVMALSFSFESEVIGATRYQASITVRFDPEAVRHYLSSHGVRYVDEPAPQILIVPVLVEQGVPRLWEEAKPWADAIAADNPGSGLAPARLPENGRGDHEMDPDYLMSLARLETTELRMRYRAHSVLLAIAEPKDGSVRLTLRGEDAAGLVDTSMNVSGGLDAAAATLVGALQTRWKRVMGGGGIAAGPPPAAAPSEGALRGSVGSRETSAAAARLPGIHVRVILRRDDDWRDIRSRIERAGGISGLSLDHIEPGLAEIRIWPTGSPDELAGRLGRQGLDLFRAGQTWMLQGY